MKARLLLAAALLNAGVVVAFKIPGSSPTPHASTSSSSPAYASAGCRGADAKLAVEEAAYVPVIVHGRPIGLQGRGLEEDDVGSEDYVYGRGDAVDDGIPMDGYVDAMLDMMVAKIGGSEEAANNHLHSRDADAEENEKRAQIQEHVFTLLMAVVDLQTGSSHKQARGVDPKEDALLDELQAMLIRNKKREENDSLVNEGDSVELDDELEDIVARLLHHHFDKNEPEAAANDDPVLERVHVVPRALQRRGWWKKHWDKLVKGITDRLKRILKPEDTEFHDGVRAVFNGVANFLGLKTIKPPFWDELVTAMNAAKGGVKAVLKDGKLLWRILKDVFNAEKQIIKTVERVLPFLLFFIP